MNARISLREKAQSFLDSTDGFDSPAVNIARFVENVLRVTPEAAAALVDSTAAVVPNAGYGTPDMAHAMSRLDGYDHDRDMPGLQRWLDYHDASVLASPYRRKDDAR